MTSYIGDNSMTIIGLGHYSRTGKDTFANALVQSIIQRDTDVQVKKIPFAWKLKQVAHELYEWAGMKPPEHYDTLDGEKDRDIVLPLIGKTPVQVWVDLGTPAIREQVYDRTWIDYVLYTEHDADILIIPDVRFPNEVDALREVDAILCKIVRPGYGPRNTVSDRALLGYEGWDYYLGAETVTGLHLQAQLFAIWLLGGPKPKQTIEERESWKRWEVVQ